MIGMLSLQMMQLEIINYGLVKKVSEALTFLIDIFILDLDLNYIDKL